MFGWKLVTETWFNEIQDHLQRQIEEIKRLKRYIINLYWIRQSINQVKINGYEPKEIRVSPTIHIDITQIMEDTARLIPFISYEKQRCMVLYGIPLVSDKKILYGWIIK